MPIRARDNPFRTERVLTIRYRFGPGQSWEALQGRLAECGQRGAIVGPEGSGKTTLQEDLAERIAAAGQDVCWLRFNRENRGAARRQIAKLPRQASSRTFLLVDGAEQLGPVLWRRLKRISRNFAGLVITTHRPGRLPTLMECCTTPELLTEIAGELSPSDVHSPALLKDLYHRHNGNLRLCLRELYDRWSPRHAGAGDPD